MADQNEHVPTVRELYAMQGRQLLYVRPVAWDKKKNPTIFQLLDAGYALLGDIMRRNAARARAQGLGDWEDPYEAEQRAVRPSEPSEFAYDPDAQEWVLVSSTRPTRTESGMK